jgi:hypothetical protein
LDGLSALPSHENSAISTAVDVDALAPSVARWSHNWNF